MPLWLFHAHRESDATAGPTTRRLSDEEILKRLLALNLERSRQGMQ
jgi:hypothetical protein